MTKDAFLAALRNERTVWDALVSSAPVAAMTVAGVAGDWSLKDVIAHIAWHEDQMVGMLHARAFTGSPLWSLPTHERNAAIYEENRGRSLDDVLADARRTFEELVAALGGVSDADLVDPSHFPGMPPQWQPWQIIAQNSYEHYQHHTGDVQAWLDRS